MTTPQTALAVIEEALKTAAYTDDFAPDYAKREAPAVLQRVLAALGGEPCAWLYEHPTLGRNVQLEDHSGGYGHNWTITPLYAAPPAAIPAEVDHEAIWKLLRICATGAGKLETMIMRGECQRRDEVERFIAVKEELWETMKLLRKIKEGK